MSDSWLHRTWVPSVCIPHAGAPASSFVGILLKGSLWSVRESGLQEELQDRQHHKIKSQRRWVGSKQRFNKSMRLRRWATREE
eukprot:scaffold237678_cov17-Tisochrysis_lutea.AAC.1